MAPRLKITCTVLAAALVLGASVSTASGRDVPGDAFLCGDARVPKATRGGPAPAEFHARVAVSVIDRFTRPLPNGRYTLDLRKAEAFCRPVRLDDDDLTAPLHGIELYEARRTRRKPALPPLPPTTEVVETAFGTLRLKVGNIETLAVPTVATGSVGGTNAERDHFACYQVRAERAPGARQRGFRISVQTAETPRIVELKKPVALCVPASVRGEDPGAPKHPVDLVCWDVRLPPDGEPPPVSEILATRNGFGNELLKVAVSRRLCVPAARIDVAVPTPTPFPTFTPPPTPAPTATPGPTPQAPTIRIEPSSVDGLLRDRQCLTAVRALPDGGTVDVTANALWRIGDGTVAVPSGFLDGKKCFVGVGIGTTAITARDPATGVTSPAASFRATWPIFKLTVTPRQIGLRIGETETLTVIAELTGNRTRNVTQHVRYESSDSAIAAVPNTAGNRSRIQAEDSGRTTITVSDTFSSLSDAVNVAVGSLQSVVVDTGPLLFPGETASMKAVGVFSAGFNGNVTQVSSWDSSDPGVVVAINAPGDRSRIEAVRPGTAVVNATDLLSGIRSTCCGSVSVLGDVLDLVVTPLHAERRIGVDLQPITLSARGEYAVPPGGSASRTVNERVTWSSSDESVVAIGDLDAQNRREILVVGGGQASVVATDPASAVASQAATITIYEHLDRVDVGTSVTNPAEIEDRTIVVGEGTPYVVHGYFDHVSHRLLPDARLVASEPSLVDINGHYVFGVRPGTVIISARDLPSGLSSSQGGRDVVLRILGGLEHIALAPRTVDLDLGQSISLTATGFHVGGGTENVTQRMLYTSSDPTVVVATNDQGNSSRIVAVGVGSATISAIDPDSQVSSSTTGDDAVVTVRTDPLVRIAVSPTSRLLAVTQSSRFTAIGYYASGLARNFTQRVDWLSSDAAVALMPNTSGDRSRIEAVGSGSATISARDPLTGIRSSDSGEDATVSVGALTAIVVTPTTATIPVGGSFSFTTQGTLDSGATVNLTQDVVYASSDPSVAVATNVVGNRSQVTALAPGIVTITAFRASAYPQVTESEVATLTVVPAE